MVTINFIQKNVKEEHLNMLSEKLLTKINDNTLKHVTYYATKHDMTPPEATIFTQHVNTAHTLKIFHSAAKIVNHLGTVKTAPLVDFLETITEEEINKEYSQIISNIKTYTIVENMWLLKTFQEISQVQHYNISETYEQNMKVLENLIINNVNMWLDKLFRADRTNNENNTAYLLKELLIYARRTKNITLEEKVKKKAQQFYLTDMGFTISNFIIDDGTVNPTVEEASIMVSSLKENACHSWLVSFTPEVFSRFWSSTFTPFIDNDAAFDTNMNNFVKEGRKTIAYNLVGNMVPSLQVKHNMKVAVSDGLKMLEPHVDNVLRKGTIDSISVLTELLTTNLTLLPK